MSRLLSEPGERRRQRPRTTCRPRIERVESRELLTLFVVSTTADSGQGSLRQAIIDSNATYGSNEIDFAIEGEFTGPPTIQLDAALPPITNSVLIDGTTQYGSGGKPYVELDGTYAGAKSNGLEIQATGVTIQGLVINRFSGSGILVLEPPTSTPGGPKATGMLADQILNNYIGTDVTGTTSLGNGGYGVQVVGSNVVVGTRQAPNVIAGNAYDGIRVSDATATGITIQGNAIGTDLSGHFSLGNLGSGIDVRRGASSVTTSGNIVLANGLDGLHIENASKVHSTNDWLGAIGGSSPLLGNHGAGVQLVGASQSSVIGDQIQNNRAAGISAVGPGAGNDFLFNTICTNGGGVGIALSQGANNFQRPPTIISAVSFVANQTTVTGAVVGNPNTLVQVQFFKNPPTDRNEGCALIGTVNVLTGLNGIGVFSKVLPASVGDYLTATATETTNGTSEFTSFQVPAPFTVINTNDSGFGSLRQAVLNSNAHPGVDQIDFKIPGSGPFVIHSSGPLFVTDPVVIDAYTQAGSRANTSFTGDNAVIQVALDGTPPSGATQPQSGNAAATGFIITSGGTTIRGMAIGNFGGAGIYILGPGDNHIEGNFLGTDTTGTQARPNSLAGVLVGGSTVTSVANWIGGTTTAAQNVISGNNGPGVYLFGNTAGNHLEGNFIGTDPSGRQALGNANTGVLISDSPGNFVGGITARSGNLISGNRAAGTPNPNADPATSGAAGVVIVGAGSTGNIVAGNLIGTTIDGLAALPNAFDGLDISGAAGNIVGGAGLAGNTISGNGFAGVRIAGAGATGNLVLGNRIGVDVTGGRPLGNHSDGIFINQAPSNRIGIPGLGNVIAANAGSGVNILGATARGNLVQANQIGAPGLANLGFGVVIQDATGNTIGGTLPAAGNSLLNNRLGPIGVFIGGYQMTPGVLNRNLVVGNTSTPNGPLARSVTTRSTRVAVAQPRRQSTSVPSNA